MAPTNPTLAEPPFAASVVLKSAGVTVTSRPVWVQVPFHPLLTDSLPAGKVNAKVQPVIGKNEMLFLLSGSASAVLHGKIKGSTMTIAITPALQQPAPGVFSALSDLQTSISKKKGKAALVTSRGCKSHKHLIKVTVGYAPNPAAPSKPSASSSANAVCS